MSAGAAYCALQPLGRPAPQATRARQQPPLVPCAAEDELGRQRLAETIARQALKPPGSEGLVVGVIGAALRRRPSLLAVPVGFRGSRDRTG